MVQPSGCSLGTLGGSGRVSAVGRAVNRARLDCVKVATSGVALPRRLKQPERDQREQNENERPDDDTASFLVSLGHILTLPDVGRSPLAKDLTRGRSLLLRDRP